MNPLGDTLVMLSLICFGFALACFVADEVLPRLFRKRDPWEARCADDPECMLERGHQGEHYTDEYL